MLNKYLIGASLIALTFSLTINTANAESCPTMPTCAQLGYNKTSCGSLEYVRCPFDQSKMRCLADTCRGYYPSSENGGCYPGIGELTYCSTDSSKCRYTRCYKYFYDDPSYGYETHVVFQDGKCIEGDSSGGSNGGCFDLEDIPDSVKNDPLIDLSESCGGNLVKPSCKIGLYWYGKCYMTSIQVGDYITSSHGQLHWYKSGECTGSCVGNEVFGDYYNLTGGIVFDVGDSYIKIFKILDKSTCLGTQGAPYHGDGYTQYTQQEAMADLSGYDNTQELINDNIGITFMNNLNTHCGQYFGANAKCYIPSLGELDLATSRVWQPLGDVLGSTMGARYPTSSMADTSDILWTYYSGNIIQLDTMSQQQDYTYCPFVILLGDDTSQSGESGGESGGGNTPACGSPSIGDIVYTDGSCSSSLENGKTAKGIVFDATNRQALELETSSMIWGSSLYDLPNLSNFISSTDAETDMNGAANTTAIIEFGSSENVAYVAAPHCNNKGMYLPSFGQLKQWKTNYTTINTALTNIGGHSINDAFYSSTEYGQDGVWQYVPSDGYSFVGGKSGSGSSVRCAFSF